MMNAEQLLNKESNEREYSLGNIYLQSRPTHIVLCTTYKCNMKCSFCSGRGEDPDFNHKIYEDIFERKLLQVFKKATHIFFNGWGEILIWPGIDNFLDYLNKYFPEARKTFTTNGLALSERLINKIAESNYTIQVSLHSCQSLIHSLLTQSDHFDQIVSQLDKLILLKKRKDNPESLWIVLMFLITTVNIKNLPDFVDFAGLRGIDEIFCNYITVYRPEQLGLSCFFVPQAVNSIFDEAQERSKKYNNMKLHLPPRFQEKTSVQQNSKCQDPWSNIFIDALGNVHPCCFSGKPIGNINSDDFETIWNGEQYRQLRKSLAEGKPHDRCKNCYKFSPINVNDIRSHITFRDIGIKEDILKFSDSKK